MSANEMDDGAHHNSEKAIDAQFKTLADRVAKTADSDLKEFLSGVLKTTEATLADLGFMRKRLDKMQIDADTAIAVAQKEKKDASDTAYRSDIRAEAYAAGAFDPADVLPFISLSDVKCDENGKSNILELIDGLKKSKPHLFRRVNTSATHPVPRPGNAAPRNALEMTAVEYRTAKARVIRR